MYLKQFFISIRSLIVLSILTGIAYPLAITGIAQLVFSHEANGSLISKDGKAVGSELIGQPSTALRHRAQTSARSIQS
jgi:K+-transporting ATPase ATPase C chain